MLKCFIGKTFYFSFFSHNWEIWEMNQFQLWLDQRLQFIPVELGFPLPFWLCSSCLDLYPHKMSVSSGRSEDILRPQADICLSPFEPKPEPLFGIWIEKKTKQEKAPSALVVREDNSGSGKTGIFFCSFMGLEHLICIQWACSSCLQKWLL